MGRHSVGLAVPARSGDARRCSLRFHERALRPLLEAFGASGEPLAARMPVRPSPRALGLRHAPLRSLDRASVSISRPLGTACAPPGDEPRDLGPREPGYRCRSREKQRSLAPCLHAVPRSGDHDGERDNVSKPASACHVARALDRSVGRSVMSDENWYSRWHDVPSLRTNCRIPSSPITERRSLRG